MQRCMPIIILAAALGLARCAHADTGPAAATATALTDYGISQALAWHTDRAESAFVSLLSQHRGDARALNNLGNLSLLKGELAVALSFYDGALKADSTDAGVHLNRSMVFMLMGEDARAVEEATRAVHLAGGSEHAGALVGVHDAAADSSRAAEKKWLTRAELRALLNRASQAVPSDTVRRTPAANPSQAQGKPAPKWRSGATRAADDR